MNLTFLLVSTRLIIPVTLIADRNLLMPSRTWLDWRQKRASKVRRWSFRHRWYPYLKRRSSNRALNWALTIPKRYPVMQLIEKAKPVVCVKLADFEQQVFYRLKWKIRRGIKRKLLFHKPLQAILSVRSAQPVLICQIWYYFHFTHDKYSGCCNSYL